jgi:putative ABC transport system permease protein
MLNGLWLDIRVGFKGLSRSPRFAAWIVGSLGVGMAATTAAFALLNALLFQPFPGVAAQGDLVRVTLAGPCADASCAAAQAMDRDEALALAALPGLAAVAAHRGGVVAVGLPEARTLRAVFVSPSYFDVLGANPALGRFRRGEWSTGVVIARRTWQQAFAADPNVLARAIRLGDRLVPIAGVAAPAFAGIDVRPARGDPGPDLWVPLALAPRPVPSATDASYALTFVGRLRDGVDRAAIAAQADAQARRLSGEPTSPASRPRAEVTAVTIGNPRHRALTVAVVLPIPVLVLVIACVNAAHVLLARGAERQRELAVRLALGAGRARIVRQLLVESLALAVAATALAIPLAWWGLRFAAGPIGLPIRIDGVVVAVSVLTALATTLVFGVGPALRVSNLRPSSTLGVMGVRDQASPSRSRVRRWLLVGQIALSIALMGTAWQLVATVRSGAVTGGVAPDRLLVARFDLAAELPGPAQAPFYRELLAGAERMAGVEGAGLASFTAFWSFGGRSPGALRVWAPADGPDDGRTVAGGPASAGVFEAVGVRLLAGRGFTAADAGVRPAVAVLSDTAARRLGAGAVGSLLRVAPAGQSAADAVPVRVVGVVASVAEPRLDRGEEPQPRVYLPSPLEPQPALALYLRTRGPAAAVAQPLRDLVARLAPTVPVVELGSLEELHERSYAPQLWLARIGATLGLVGLVLAAVGLFGVASHAVSVRSRELAVRMALGASPRRILRMILAEAMGVALVGLAMGGIGAILVSRAIQAGYHGIERLDGGALGGAAVVFVGAMLIASAVPAWRASRLDPMATLKDG